MIGVTKLVEKQDVNKSDNPQGGKTVSVTKKSAKKERRSDSKARSASAAVFFNDNKSIAGFGNPLRAVFTSIRELVENALDAAEKRNVTPNIYLRLRRMTIDEVSNLMDMDSTRLGNKKLDFLQLTCRDNGVGVPRELIPQLFGTVLAGTKYGAQQTRGRFGLGSKMVLLYSMSTLDLPIQITTRPLDSNVTYRVKLKINLEQNKPIIISDEEIHEGDPEFFEDYGTEVTVSFTGNWGQAKNYVREYFKQLAIITPYADMHIFLPGDEPGTEDELLFKRVVDDLPKPPEVVPVHPWGTDITTFRREMALADPNDTVVEFLSKNFMGVSPQAAEAFFEEVGVDPKKKPSELTEKDIRRIVHDGFQRAFREAKEIKRKRDRVFKFDDPKGDALSPLGADRLRKGIEKELEPLFVEAITRPPRAYEGHPFIIEAAIGYGGGVNKATASKGATIIENKIIYRYANRIPLIFGAGNDVIKQVIDSIKWNEYGLTRQSDPLAIAVSLVSTKIPFPETSKEYIDKVDEIAEEVKLALLQLGRKLKSFLNRSRRKQRERQRRSRFERYAPQTAQNLLEILKRANRWDPDVGLKPERLIAALSSGEPRIGRFDLPRGRPIIMEPIWIPEKWKKKLQSENIFTTEEFLRTPNNKIAKLLSVKAEKVDFYKRKTILVHGEGGNIPDLPIDLLVAPEIERRFHSRDAEIQLPHLSKALPRRWIQTAWDYLVTPPTLLDKVQGLLPKLIEEMKLMLLYEIQQYNEKITSNTELISSLENMDFDNSYSGPQTQGALTEEDKESLKSFLDPISEEQIPKTDPLTLLNPKNLLPDVETLLKFQEIKKRKAANHIEILIETSHPSNPLTSENLGSDLIEFYLTKIEELSKENPSVLEIKVDSPQPFLDGYSRNAFKRRKIATIGDLINTPKEIVFEIRELQRFLFGHLIETLSEQSTPLEPFSLVSETGKLFIPMLQEIGIETLEELALLNAHEISTHKKIGEIRTLLFEDSKDRVISSLIEKNDVSSLDDIKVIDTPLEKYINDNNLEELYVFLATPIEESEFKEDLLDLKKKYSDKLNILGKSVVKILNTVNVYTFEEFYYNFDAVYQAVTDEKDREKLSEIFVTLAESIHLLSEELIPSMNFLIDAGINTIGKFLMWPKDEVSNITGLSQDWLELLQEGFRLKDIEKAKKNDISIEKVSFLIPTELDAARYFNVTTIGQLVSILWKDQLPKSLSGDKFVNHNLVNQTLFSPLTNIEGIFKDKSLDKSFQSAMKKLADKGVRNFLQILNSPKTKLSSMVTGKKATEAMNLFLYLIDHPDTTEIDTENIFFRVAQLYNAKRKLDLSLVHLSQFSSAEIDSLGKYGVKRIYQIYLTPPGRIAKFLGKSKKAVEEKIENSSLKLYGTPIAVEISKGRYKGVFEFEVDNIPHFSHQEIQSLIEAGYDTIEKLYYLTEVKTFEVYGLTWNVISQMKSLLRSPAVLLSWREEIPSPPVETEVEEEQTKPRYRYITLDSEDLKRLSDAKLTRVFDFLTTPTEDLARILNWSIEKTRDRQISVILQEVGIDLESLNLFRPIQITHLRANDLLTLEDLYFSTFEESWDSYLVPWEAINTIKQLLQLPIKFAEEELGEEIIQTLSKSGIQTIIDFLLTGDKILEQRTGLPAERFENLKHALEFSSLVEAYDKTIFFTPNLRYFHAKKLHDRGIKSILNFLLTSPDKISKITGLSKREISLILDNISRETVAEAEQENGIPLKDINVFRKGEIRTITKSGIFESSDIDTLQELKYQLESDSFINDPALATLIKDIQMVLDLPLKELPSITEEELALLETRGIISLADLLFVSDADLLEEGKELDILVTRLTNRFIDFRPFVAMAKIPATSVAKESTTGSILENWLNSPDKLDKNTIRRLPSLLLLELKQSTFASYVNPSVEELQEETVAEILIRYAPEHNDWLIPLFEAFNAPGFLIELSQSGNTPITLLDLEPHSFRALIEANLATIEELILRDPYELAEKTGLSLKFFRDLRDNFSTTKFKSLLTDLGVPVTVIPEEEFIASLKEMGIEYLDQAIPVTKTSNQAVRDLKEFLFSNVIHMAGSPGEMEFAVDKGAETIIEAIIVFRTNDLDKATIKDILHLSWFSWTKYSIPVKDKWLIENRINSLQNLELAIRRNKNVPKKALDLIKPYLESPLFLDIEGKVLVDIVDLYRCSTVLHLISNPIAIPHLPEKTFKQITEGKFKVVKEVELPSSLIKNISPLAYRNLTKDGQNISIQEILSAPRGLSSYMGIRQSYLRAAREALKVPLTRIIHNNERLSRTFTNVWLDDLIYSLPSLYSNEETREEALKIINILTQEFSLASDIPLSENSMEIVSTALGEKIEGFHKLWAVSWTKARAIENSHTEFAFYTKQVISKSFLPIAVVPNVGLDEAWHFWKLNIITVADFLLTPIDTIQHSFFSKRRLNEIQSLAIAFITELDIKEDLPSVEITSIQEIPLLDPAKLLTLPLLYASTTHPLGRSLPSFHQIHYTLTQPIFTSKLSEVIQLSDLKELFEREISSLIDLLVYPLSDIPVIFKDYAKRISLVADNLMRIKEDFDVRVLNPPKDMMEFLIEKNISTISEFLEFYAVNKTAEFSELVFSHLRYSFEDIEIINELKKKGYSTLYDLLLLKLDDLPIVNCQSFEDYYKVFDLNRVQSRIDETLLKIKDFEELSGRGLEKLIENHTISVLDLEMVPLDLSKADEKNVSTILSILECPTIVLLFDEAFKPYEKEILDISKIPLRLTLENPPHSELGKKLKSLSFGQLLQLIDHFRPLNLIEEIKAPDAKKLNRDGIYLYGMMISQMDKVSEILDLDDQQRSMIIDILSSPVDRIVNLSPEIIQNAKELGLSKVHELLDDPRLREKIEDSPLVVARKISLGEVFEDEIAQFLETCGISTMAELLHTDGTSLYSENDELFAAIILRLNLDVGRHSSLRGNWVNSLKKAGIHRIWQFLVEDETNLQEILGASLKNIREFKETLVLTKDKLNTDVNGLFKENKILLTLTKLGIFDFDEVIPPVFPATKLMKDEYSNLLSVAELLKTKVWQFEAFWEMSLEAAETISNKISESAELLDVASANIYPDFVLNVLNSPSKRTLIPLKEFKFNENELKAAEKGGIKTFENWLFEYLRENEIAKSLTEIRGLFRSSILLLDPTPAQARKLFDSNISHISDLLLNDFEKVAKRFRLKVKEIESIPNPSDFEPQIYPIGYFSKTMLEPLESSHFVDWMQLLGNLMSADISDISGLTPKSFSSGKELFDTGIWESTVLLDFGLEANKNLVTKGILTIGDLLIAKRKLISDCLGIDPNQVDDLFLEIKKSTINKARKEDITRLSVSRKIKVGDLEEFEKIGIRSVLQIAIGAFNEPKDEDQNKAISDIKRILEIPIEAADLPLDVISSAKKNGMKTIGHFIYNSDSKLKTITKITPKGISVFRKSLPYDAKKVSTLAKSSKAKKKTQSTKKVANKKKSASSTKKKSGSSKKSGGKKKGSPGKKK